MNRLFEAFECVIEKDVLRNWTSYLERFRMYDKWLIFSDYCFDKNKPNDVVSYVIVPYITDFDNFFATISNYLPRDLKKQRDIYKYTLVFLNMKEFFSFSFIIDDEFWMYKLTKEAISILVDKYIDLIDIWLGDSPIYGDKKLESYYKKIQKKLIKLKEHLKCNNWNKKLIINILFVSFMTAYIYYLIDKYSHPKIIGWFPDRDSMITFNENILYDLARIQIHTILHGDYNFEITFGFGDKNGLLWYDEGIKLPDYLCGTIASIPDSVLKPKHIKLGQGVLVNNGQVIVYKLDSGIKRIHYSIV